MQPGGAGAGAPASKVVTSPAGEPLARVFDLDAQPARDPARYPLADRQRIVEQLRLLLREFYVHLEMKKAQYGFDAVRALDRLESAISELSDVDFHESLIQVITRTRDRHLQFIGRNLNGFAALGLLIERCFIDGEETYVVTKIASSLIPQRLKVGAVVTHWNAVPIGRHVRLTANLFDGGNEPASLARCIEYLTIRSLSQFATPIEAWVVLRFVVAGNVWEERFDWQGFDVSQAPLTPGIGRNIIGFGGDQDVLDAQTTKRVLFAPQSFDAPEVIVPAAGPPVRHFLGRAAKSNFQYGVITTADGAYGYIRMYDFAADDVDDIANDMRAILPLLPREGLIIDIRGNNGGYIAAGERLLQLFTPRDIVPTRFQFRATPGVRRMLSATSYFDRWQQSILDAGRTGEPFSQGYPIEGSDADANRIGQQYFGPVILVTDALAFSTADIFAAGFIDHDIGKVMCIDKNMAAAGGNNWRFGVLILLNPDFQIDLALSSELESGVLSAALKEEFSRRGVLLTEKAAVRSAGNEFDGRVWEIQDGSNTHRIRHVPWLSQALNVYASTSRSGIAPLPEGVGLGFTIRRCIRSGKSEGRLLEDLGIQPDIIYRPTLNDVLGDNEDLLTRAAHELSAMPVYDLAAGATVEGDRTTVVCAARNVTRLDLFQNDLHIGSADVPESGNVRFDIPGTPAAITVKGFLRQRLVGKLRVAPVR